MSSEKKMMTGNEAIALGALESGIRVATSYPGTPVSEILKTILNDAESLGIHAEWAINEKMAFEIAAGASYAGVRALFCTKHLGLNTVLDSLSVIAYTGVRGGLVLVVGDDPEPTSSQTAVDTRYHAILSKVPCLEPTTGQEAKDLVPKAFKLSEKFGTPVIVRITPMIAHSLFAVRMGERIKPSDRPKFLKNPDKYVCMPHNTKTLHDALNQKEEAVRIFFDRSSFNKLELKGARLSIVASGFSYNFVKDALSLLGLKANVLKLMTTHPVPERTVRKFLASSKRILVVEELEPVVENFVNIVARREGFRGEILGKWTKHIPRIGELNVQTVVSAICGAVDRKDPFAKIKPPKMPRTIPSLCAGCPHRSSYYSLHKILRGLDGYNVVGDRGCYNVGAHPPLRAIDTCLCMGASIGIGYGLVVAGVKEKTVSVIGDSTFFHSGIPGLINAVQHNIDLTLLILDNNYTSLTGHQPNPGTGLDEYGREASVVEIEKLVMATGVKYYRRIDPYDLQAAEEAIRGAIAFNGPSVVHLKRECALLACRKTGAYDKNKRYVVEGCNACMYCMKYFACPAFYVEDGKMKISQEKCVRCGACVQVCPTHAIKEKKQNEL